MSEKTIIYPDDPITLFKDWFQEAKDLEPINPNAMALATTTLDGNPAVRMVLLKGVQEDGFIFYTNADSAKGVEMGAKPMASLCFYWKSLLRQVRVDGTVSLLDAEAADAYFATRSRGSQIGAWTSKQSQPLESKEKFEKELDSYKKKFLNAPIMRPAFWTGYCVSPYRIEFWVQKEFRLHERMEYIRGDYGWKKQWLYP